jgi:hypothetical protein
MSDQYTILKKHIIPFQFLKTVSRRGYVGMLGQRMIIGNAVLHPNSLAVLFDLSPVSVCLLHVHFSPPFFPHSFISHAQNFVCASSTCSSAIDYCLIRG